MRGGREFALYLLHDVFIDDCLRRLAGDAAGRIIANEKLRMLSPPRMKIQSNTINVDVDVLMVRANVSLIDALKSC